MVLRRTFALHKRRETLATSTLYEYQCNCSRRVIHCVVPQPTPHARRHQMCDAKIEEN
jgi:hypothetical protein